MRILFVTAGFLPESIGGVELHLLGIARSLAAAHQVTVFSRTSRPDRPEFELSRDLVEGIPVVRLNYLFSDCDRFERIYRNPEIRARFEQVLAEVRPDVVHVHHLTCLSTDLVDAARQAGARVVLTLHDFWMGCPRGQRMTPELELCEEIRPERCAPCLAGMWPQWFGPTAGDRSLTADEVTRRDLTRLREYHEWIHGILNRVDRLVTPSRSSAELFARQGIGRERITVIENGLDHAPLVGIERTPSDRFRFGFIGSVLPTKGIHVLLDAFGRLGRDDCTLEIHGEHLPWHEVTDYGECLREQAGPLGERVRFHGRYEAGELPRLLADLDALVVPSLWFEAFCLTLREGFLAGLPVVVSDLGAMAEGVEEGVTGLLFRPGDAADLARQMARLLDEPGLAGRLAASDKQVGTLEQNAADLLALYAEVRGGEGG